METNRNIYLWDGSQWVFDRTVIGGGNHQPVNKNLKPSYANQYNIAVQRQIGNTMAVGIRGIYNKWYDLIDDVKTLRRRPGDPHAAQLPGQLWPIAPTRRSS